jgi:hypothetical protein
MKQRLFAEHVNTTLLKRKSVSNVLRACHRQTGTPENSACCRELKLNSRRGVHLMHAVAAAPAAGGPAAGEMATPPPAQPRSLAACGGGSGGPCEGFT